MQAFSILTALLLALPNSATLTLPSEPENLEPRDGWTSLPIPSLCLPPSSGTANELSSGTHLDLGDLDLGSPVANASAYLPLVQLIELLEADARRVGTDLRCLRTAPPLLVRGSTTGIDRAREILSELDRAGRAQRIQLDVALAPADSSNSPSATSFELRSGESLQLGDQNSIGFLADYDVDVASGVGTSFPAFGRVLVGQTARLTAWRTPDGKAVFVSGDLSLAELVELSKFDTGSTELGKFDKPLVGSVDVHFSGLIESGGELRVEVRGAPLTQRDWNLSVRAKTGADVPDAWRIVDLAWMESSESRPRSKGPGAGLRTLEVNELESVETKPLSSAVMWAELQASFAGRRTDRPLFGIAPGVLVAPADDSRIWAELDPLLAAATQSRSTTYPIGLRAGELEVNCSAAEGLFCSVRSGFETTALVDFDVELAQDYWMADPIVRRIFDGFSLEAQLYGGELIGSYWKSETVRTGSIETDHGMVVLPERNLSRRVVRVSKGESKQLNSDLSIRVGSL